MIKDHSDINISAREAWQMLESDANSCLVDVRSLPEWNLVGLPNLSALNKEIITVSWRVFPTMQINEKFIEQIGKISKSAKIIFICKTGGRSFDAAQYMIENGYSNCYNLINGFEGDLDNNGHRGFLNGWKANNLPWRQM